MKKKLLKSIIVSLTALTIIVLTTGCTVTKKNNLDMSEAQFNNEVTNSDEATSEYTTVIENDESTESVLEKFPQTDIQTNNSESDSDENYSNENSDSILSQLGTDYNKVNWGVTYSPEGMEGIVISVAPYWDGSTYSLILGITNLYDASVTFSAKAYAKDSNGNTVGEKSIYDVGFGPGNTIIHEIYCYDGTPTGEIHWEEIELKESKYDEYAYWESDWELKSDSNGYVNVNYNIYSDSTMTPGYVNFLMLDKDGNIIYYGDDYVSDESKSVTKSYNTYQKVDRLSALDDMAVFSNPLKVR